MSFKKKVALAITLSLIMAQNSAGAQPRPLEAVPQAEFREVIIYDSFEHPKAQATRVPALKLTPTAKATSKTKTKFTNKSNRVLTGLASYYCCTNGYPRGNYAAAGPKLRVALGGGYSAESPQPWKGKTITVCGSKGCVKVTLVDWCQCYWKKYNEKVIDLYKNVFFNIGAERGTVTISW